MAGIVEFIAGPLFGLVGGAITKYQDLQMTKEANKHELKKFDFELQMRDKERLAMFEKNEQEMAANQQETEGDLAKFVTEGSYAGLKASIEADAKQIGTSYKWVEAIRSLMRPGLTLTGMAALTVMCFYSTPNIQEAAAMSMFTNGSMMIAWWFGDRSATKVNSRFVKN